MVRNMVRGLRDQGLRSIWGDRDRLCVPRAKPTIHVVLAYHSLRRRRGCYAVYDSRETGGPDEESSVLLDSSIHHSC